MSDKPKKCAHPSCTCPAPSDSKYCSSYCKDAGKTMEIGCNCRHADCSISGGVASTA